ncbi:MAG: hypothetical protein K0S76_2441 [Herbinix sp.]|jgi:hypothetical protein|nr:hypothetical protein [Herbinix sp.]
MDMPRKLIVGYDLGEDVSQISCFSQKTSEPITIGPKEGDEHYLIPTVICVRKDTRLWLCGNEAEACARKGDGEAVDHLLEKVRRGEEIEVLGQNFTAISLLEKFLRKSLMLIKNYFPTEPITKLVITLRETEPVIVDGIYHALDMIGIGKDRAMVISHTGAYLYYVLNQDRSQWMNDVGLFDFNETGFYYYQMNINRRTKPMIAGVTKREFTDTLNCTMINRKDLNLSYTLENIVNTILYRQSISTLYFTGNGFEGGWAEGVLKKLCAGRRVFLGQNLYTKGACYAAKEMSGDQTLSDYVLLNDDMIQASVGLKVYCDAMVKEVLLTEAALPWYEVNSSIEVIPEEEAELEIIIKNIMTREIIREKITIKPLPERPKRMTRLEIKLTFINRTSAKITITDLGFGDFYKSTEQTWEYTFDIV